MSRVTAVDDVQAAEANHDVIVQRIADEDPDLVYSLEPALMSGVMIRAGIDIPQITSESDEDLYLNLGVDPNDIQLHVYAPAQNKTIWERGTIPCSSSASTISTTPRSPTRTATSRRST